MSLGRTKYYEEKDEMCNCTMFFRYSHLQFFTGNDGVQIGL